MDVKDSETPLVEPIPPGEIISGVLPDPRVIARLSNLFSSRVSVSRMWTIVLSFLLSVVSALLDSYAQVEGNTTTNLTALHPQSRDENM